MCSEYVREIFSYLRQLERVMEVRPHYLKGQEVSGAMRAVVVDWLMQVQREFKLRVQTSFMSVGLMDRFLQNHPVPKKRLELVCVSAMLIACKYEEIHPPTAGDFAFRTDGAFTCRDVCVMEKIILESLSYRVGRPVSAHFLQRLCKVSQEQALVMFLLELSAVNYELVHVSPSLRAASALASARRILGCGGWSLSLELHSGYVEETLSSVMQLMLQMLEKLPQQCKWEEVRRRYLKVSSEVFLQDGRRFQDNLL